MSHQYQPTSYYSWPDRLHGIFLDSGSYEYVPYDYYAGDEIYNQNTVFRGSQYVTYDNTHARFLNLSDIHIYDTGGIKIYDSGTLTLYTSASMSARKFVVDEYGRVGIGMDHLGPHSNVGESPSFDLDVKGQVGVEDYIYHNDNTSTYLLFGSDRDDHNVNTNGAINTVYPSDNNEINLFTGDIAMLQMKSRDSIDLKITCPSTILDGTGVHAYGNPIEEQIKYIISTTLGTLYIELTEDILLDGKLKTPTHPDGWIYVYVDTTLAQRDQYIQVHERIMGIWNNAPENSEYTFDVSPIGVMEHYIVNDSSILEVTSAPGYPANGSYNLVSVLAYTELTNPGAATYDLGGFDQADHLTVNKYQSDVDVNVRSRTNKGAIISRGDGTEVVINSDGNSDTDFRVESEREPHMLFVDTSVNRISIGDSEDTPQATLEVTNDPDSGAFDVPLVQLNNEDTDKQLLDINAKNIDADVISVSADDLVSADVMSVTADSLTTGDVLNATADSLTTGSLIHMTHTGSDKSEVSLVHFESTGDRGDDSNQTVLLDLNFDTTDGTGARTLRIDSEQTTGMVVDIDAQRITSGTAVAVSATDLTTGTGFILGMDSRTTGTGMHVTDTHDSDSAGALVKIEQTGDRAGSEASIGVDIDFNTTANPAARALRIDSEQTTGDIVEIDGYELTTGTALDISGVDNLTTGTIANLHSNSGSADNRDLVKITNDNIAATGTRLLHIKNDAIASSSEETIRFESTAADKNPLLELRNSNNATDTPALLNFKRSQTNPSANMDLGTITFEGADSNDTDTVYAAISARATDITHAQEAGVLNFMVQATDSPSQLRNMLSIGGQTNDAGGVETQAEVVINEDQIDLDFRVETDITNNAFIVYGDGSEVVVNENGVDTDFRVEVNGLDPTQYTKDDGSHDDTLETHYSAKKTHALYVNAENGRVGIGHDAPQTTLHVAGSAHIEGDLWVKGVTNQIDTMVHVTSSMDIHNTGTGPTLTVTQSGAQPVATFWDMDHDDALQPALYLADKTMAGFGTMPAVPLHVSDTIQNFPTENPYATFLLEHNYEHGGIMLDSTLGDKQTHVRFASAGELKWQIRNKLQYNNCEVGELGIYSWEYGGDVINFNHNGNIGIGTSCAQSKLRVQRSDGISIYDPIDTTPPAVDSSTLSLANIYQGGHKKGTYSNIQFVVNGGDQVEGTIALVAEEDDSAGGLGKGALVFAGDPGNATRKERMRITGDGLIGMGTTAPSGWDGESNQLVIADTSHTGITIASGTTESRGNIYFADGIDGAEKYRGGITYDHDDDNLSLRTASTERVWIDSIGRVGVGLAVPESSLDVKSTIRAISGAHVPPTGGAGVEIFATVDRGYIFNHNRDTNKYHDLHLNNSLYIAAAGDQSTRVGNVGINQATPFTKLYINSTDGVRIPIGTTAQRPTSGAFGITGSPATADFAKMHGTIRYNTTQHTFEGFGPGNTWGSLGGVIDVDRDTYWTAVNDLDNIHNDEFDTPNAYNTYPGDTDYLRAFTDGLKRFAIASDGDVRFYKKTSGNGTATNYGYTTYLEISHETAANKHGAVIESASGNITLKPKTGTENDFGLVNIDGHDGVDHGLALNGTLVTATGGELNVMDGGTTASTEAISLTEDAFVRNNNGTMDQVPSSELRAFCQAGLDASHVVTTTSTGSLSAGGVTSAELLALSTAKAGTTVTGRAAIYSAGGLLPATSIEVNKPGPKPNGTWQMGVSGNGYVTGDLYVQTGSDGRLKDDITPIESPLDKIKKIGGYKFKWNENSTSYSGDDYGVIAQEVEQIMPEIVTERDNGYKALSYDRIIPLLIECVKSQQEQIEELKNKLS